VIIMNRKAGTLIAAVACLLFSISAQADRGTQAADAQAIDAARSNADNGAEVEPSVSMPAPTVDATATGKSDDVTQLGAKGVVCDESM
jgi:hypothetical protein